MSYFQLTYAGIPFVIDHATVIRIDMARTEKSPQETNTSPRKHQPMTELIDELNRLIPSDHLQDFAACSPYPGRNLGAIAHPWIGLAPHPTVKIGEWYYPHGASRWSVFRGLATSVQVQNMLLNTDGNTPAPFYMKALPIGFKKSPFGTEQSFADDYELRSLMYMLPPRPMAEHGGRFDGLYLVTLVDERYYWQNTPCTLRVRQGSTWDSLLNSAKLALNIVFDYSVVSPDYGVPEPDSQLWTNSESTPVILDAIGYNIGRSFVRDLNQTYHLYTPAESQAKVVRNRGDVKVLHRTAGGDMFTSGTKLKVGNLFKSKNSVVPTNVKVTFPKYVQGDDPVPHFLNTRYQNQRPSAWYEESYGEVYTVSVPIGLGGLPFSGHIDVSGLVGTSDHVIHDTAKALYSEEALAGTVPFNESGLNALAIKIAQDYYGSQIAAALDEVYPGTANILLEGLHDVVWTYSARARQATTRVLRTEWNQVVREMQHGTPSLSGISVNVPGIGGPSVAQTWRDNSPLITPTTIGTSLTSGQQAAFFPSIDCLPTDNRWKGEINGEKMLFEGTSGIGIVSIALRGVDGTLAKPHDAGQVVLVSGFSTVYGVNLVEFGKNQYIYPSYHTSGGIQGAFVQPQTQTIQCLAGTSESINDKFYYSGQLQMYHPTELGGTEYIGEEYVWLAERNTATLFSGVRYNGTFAGYSQSPVAPVYLTSVGLSSGSAGGSSGINSGITIINGPVTYYNVTNITYLTQYYNVIPSNSGGVIVVPVNQAKYERWWLDRQLREEDEEEENNNWYFGGEPNRASNVTLTTETAAEHFIFAMPYLEAKGAVVQDIAFWLIQGQSDAVARIGVYTNRHDDLQFPDELFFDSGEIDCSPGQEGLKIIPMCKFFQPFTLYWLVFFCRGSQVQIKSVSLNECWCLNGNHDDWVTNTAQSAWATPLTFGALPDEYPRIEAINVIGLYAPGVAVRYGTNCETPEPDPGGNEVMVTGSLQLPPLETEGLVTIENTPVEGWFCVDVGDGCPGEAMYLTAAMYPDYVDDICSGPYANEAAAEAVCGPTVTTTCCPATPLAQTLYLTLSCTACDIVEPVTIALTYVPASTWSWTGTFPEESACFDTFTWTCTSPLTATGFEFKKDGLAVGVSASPKVLDCDPFSWTVASAIFDDCFDCGPCQLTVTDEAP